MTFYRLLIFLSLVIFGQSCSTGKVKKPVVLDKVIAEFMGENYTTASNPAQTLLLTWNTRENNQTPVLYFAVWEIKTAKKVYSGTAIRGHVTWLDNRSLELYDYPGIIDDNKPLYRYKIDLITQTKTALHEEDKL